MPTRKGCYSMCKATGARMRVALFADIHGNREAFEACLDHAARQGAERQIFLGDMVGYGADPQWVVDTVMAAVARGAQALLGNHDDALKNGTSGMNSTAATAIAWTKSTLNAEAKEFLASLPYLATIVVLALISLRKSGATAAPACLGRPFKPST